MRLKIILAFFTSLLSMTGVYRYAATEIAPQKIVVPEPQGADKHYPNKLQTIAFGSCNKLNLPQDMWKSVVANTPDLWIWLGDIVYADTYDPVELTAQYKKLAAEPDYAALKKKTTIVGIYDDHDFGKNDCGKGHPNKSKIKGALLDFMDVPSTSSIRRRPGAFQSYTFGAGKEKTKVILLDTRYFRDTLMHDSTGAHKFSVNESGQMLGDIQWTWLEKELEQSDASLHILCSSVQVVSNDHGYDTWGNFPKERRRLIGMIDRLKPKNLIILSGDRHMGEISKMKLPNLPYPLYDFTSSGMTHVRSSDSESNKFRYGDLIVQRNFGLLKIDWSKPSPEVSMQIRGKGNQLYQEVLAKFE
jgi:alkaline phosphatase D